MAETDHDIMLQVKGLDAFYAKAQILFSMGLAVRRSETVALLGRNGAGKTTTFKCIMGILHPERGEIRFKGYPVHRLPSYKISQLGLGYVPEDRRIFSRLTILENLEVGRQPPRKELEPWSTGRLFKLFPNLAERRHQAAGTLSGGEQQMLTIARTLMGNPEMIILDEPFEGLAPVVVKQLAETIDGLKNEGVSVLLAEQNLNVARLICDRAYLINRGAVCHESPIETLSAADYAMHCTI